MLPGTKVFYFSRKFGVESYNAEINVLCNAEINVLCCVTELTRISLKSMLGVYIVLGVGMLVAFFTMIGEIFWNRRQKRKLEMKSETNKLR